jgi:hypothetical protein
MAGLFHERRGSMFTLSSNNRATNLTLFVIMAFVFVVSLGVVLLYGDHFLLGTYEKLNNDDVKYVNSARILINEHILAYNSGHKPSTFIMPGVPWILAGLMLLFGQQDGGVIAYRIVQVFLQTASIYLLFCIARYVFNHRVALIACVISALYLPDYFSSGVILSETWFKTIFMLLISCSIVALKKKQLRYYAIVAVLLASACYFKPHSILFAVIIAFMWLIHKYSWKQMVTLTALIAVIFCVCLSPWWIRNYVTFGHWVTFTESAGNPLLQGALIYKRPPSEGFFKLYPQYTPKTLFQGGDQGQVDTAKRIVRYGFYYEPVQYFRWYVLQKPVELYKWPFYWKTVFNINKEFMNKLQYWLVFASVLGIILSLIRRNGKPLFVLLAFLYFTVIYLPFVTFSRYGYPNMFILILFAAYFLYNLYQLLPVRRVSTDV